MKAIHPARDRTNGSMRSGTCPPCPVCRVGTGRRQIQMWRACLHAPPLRWLIGLSGFPPVSGRALKLPDYGGACGANTYAHIGKGRAFPRAAVWVLLALLSVTWGLEAFGQLSTRTRSNVLGQSDAFGYARVVQELGSLDTGGRPFPLNLVFSTRPDHERGIFGPGWRLPLVDSTAIAYTTYNILWEGPDERRYFFSEAERGRAGPRGEREFVHTGRKWRARVSRRGDILITGYDDPHWAFEYQAGRLQRFRMGEGAPVYRVHYRAGKLDKVVAEGAWQPALEVIYRGNQPRALRLGEERIEVALGAGDLIGADGRSLGRSGYLRSLAWEDGREASFRYEQAEPLTREVPDWPARVRNERATRERRMPVNRMVYAQGGGSQQKIEWEAESGFITADTGASYTVSNTSYDPHHQNPIAEAPRRPRISPNTVDIRRQPEGAAEQRWSRNWPGGVRIHTDNATGELVRRTLIMSSGPAYLKTRRVERKGQEDEEWRTVVQNAYDAEGRLVRSVGEGGLTQWIHEEERDGTRVVTRISNGMQVEHRRFLAGGGSQVTHFENGEAAHIIDYDAAGRRIGVRSKDGRTREYVRDDQGRVAEVRLNGLLHYRDSYSEDGSKKERVVYDRAGENPVRTQVSKFDDNGRIVVRRVIRHTGKNPDLLRRYIYDDVGNRVDTVTELVRSGLSSPYAEK